MSRDVVEITRRSIDGWNRGDFEQWAEIAHPQIEWRPESSRALLGASEVFAGPEGMRRWWHEMREAFVDLRNDLDEIRLVAQDAVLLTGTAHGRGRAAGVEVNWPFAMLLEFRDGLCVRGRTWFDVDEGARAAAALAESGSAP